MRRSLILPHIITDELLCSAQIVRLAAIAQTMMNPLMKSLENLILVMFRFFI